MDTTIMYKRIIEEAIEVATYAMSIDGAHHKDWGLDQVVRILAGDEYDIIIKEFEEETNRVWDGGVAP